MFFMYFNELNFLEICSNYKENAQFERESKLKSRISQFKRIFSIPIVGTMIKGYVVLMAKLKINSMKYNKKERSIYIKRYKKSYYK